MLCAPSARFSIKATSTRLVSPVSDQRPQPRSSARTHNDVNYGAHQPQALSCASSFQSTNLFLARRQHQSTMHSDWQKMKRKAKPFHLVSLSLSHTLSCRFITFQIKLSFPTTVFPVPVLEISRECPSSLKQLHASVQRAFHGQLI